MKKQFLLSAVLSLTQLSLAFAENQVCSQWLNSFSESGATAEKVRATVQETAEKLMRQSGKKVIELRSVNDLQTQEKLNFSDIKTKGDCASQGIILNQLAQSPYTQQANFVAEEQCAETTDLARREKLKTNAMWILDPIDGTTNYAHGLPHFSISLALMVEDQICFGAVYAPVFEEFFSAWHGKGAYLKKSEKQTPIRLSTSNGSTLNSSLWITGTSGGPASAAIRKNEITFDIARDLLPKTQDLRRNGSAALDLAFVASGRADGYFELGPIFWWDVAAGILLVEEAGGKTFIAESSQSQSTSKLETALSYVLASGSHSEIFEYLQPILNEKVTQK